MDKNFVIHNTGFSKPFEELAKDYRKNHNNDTETKPKDPSKVLRSKHEEFLRQFTEPFTKTSLIKPISDHFGIGQNKADDWAKYYIDSNLIIPTGGNIKGYPLFKYYLPF